jgi:hypothetical protein
MRTGVIMQILFRYMKITTASEIYDAWMDGRTKTVYFQKQPLSAQYAPPEPIEILSEAEAERRFEGATVTIGASLVDYYTDKKEQEHE